MSRLLLQGAIIFQILGGGYLVTSSADAHGEDEHIDLMASCIDGCDDSCDPGLPCADDCACTCCPGHGFVMPQDCYRVDLGIQDARAFARPPESLHSSTFTHRIYRPPRTA
ncbi:MAG: hypothetical protein JRG91_07440 [Deltaproteobacteria bacterium]|nr:hypothetical protein [Deltaproteobacteria bacterium]